MTAELDERFTAFVEAKGASLLRTAYLLTGNARDAEDLLQDVLAKTYVAWSRLRSEAAAETYVRVALSRSAAAWWRRRRREVVVENPPDRLGTEPDRCADRSQLWTLLRVLPPRQRTVLVLRYYEQLTEVETADVLKCSVGTVKSQTSKALATLRRRIEHRAMTVATEGSQ